MITALIWRQWRQSRRFFLTFLVVSIVLPLFPDMVFPIEGASARELLFLIWMVFSLLAGSQVGQAKRGPHSFLYARPVTRPYIFSVRWPSSLLLIFLLMGISLSAHFVYMAFEFPEFSITGVLLDPHLFFTFVLCVSLFGFSTLLSTSIAAVGLGIVVLIAFLLCGGLLILYQMIPVDVILRGLDPDESPFSFLVIHMTSISLFITLASLGVSFDELRDAKNKRWGRTILLLSCVTAIFLMFSGSLLVQSARNAAGADIKEVIVTRRMASPVVAVIPEQRESRVMAFTDASSIKSGKFKGNASSGFESPTCRGESFQVLYSGYLEKPFLVFYSDKSIWGKQIRLLDPKDDSTNNISPRLSSAEDLLSQPISSPDGDRVAYLTSRLTRHTDSGRQSLWIFKYETFPLSDHVDLPNQSNTDFEPIGWTPDGYDFMLKRRGPVGEEIWAVDWVAEGARPFLEDFGEAVIAEDDLPKAGEWISLILPQEDKKRCELWLVNYRSNQNVQVGFFNEKPLRAWADSGTWFSCWSAESGLAMYKLADQQMPELVSPCSDVPPVGQMKWAPNNPKLALVLSPSETAADTCSLVVFNPTDCGSAELVADFPSNEKQWDWLSNIAIIYATGKELWQVDIKGEKIVIFSLGPEKQ